MKWAMGKGAGRFAVPPLSALNSEGCLLTIFLFSSCPMPIAYWLFPNIAAA
jgi:hypothetical protein